MQLIHIKGGFPRQIIRNTVYRRPGESWTIFKLIDSHGHNGK
jgi:hypothetical protein